MRFGDTITTLGTPLFPGMPAGYNGADFDLLRSAPDNADGVAVVTGGQNGALLRTLAQLAGFNGTTFDRLRSGPDNADALAVSGAGILRAMSEGMLYNGASFDRARSNQDNITLANLVASSANSNSADQTNVNGRGLILVVNVTAVTGNIQFTIQGKDPVSGVYYTILQSATLSSTATTILRVYPGLTASANLIVSDLLPRTWRLLWTITTGPVTVTAGGIVLL